MEPILRKGHEALDETQAAPVHGQARPPRAAAGGDGLLRARPRPGHPARPARDRGAARPAAPPARPPGRPGRGGPRAGAGPARGLAGDGGQRLRPPQLDLPPAPRPPARGRPHRGRDRRGGALRHPRQPRLPREGGAHPPRPDPPPPGGGGARLAARGLGSRARARGPRRGGARGGLRRLSTASAPPSRARAGRAAGSPSSSTPSPAGPSSGTPCPASPSWARTTSPRAPRWSRPWWPRSGTACPEACWAGWWGARTRTCPPSWAPSPARAPPRSARCSRRCTSATRRRSPARRRRARSTPPAPATASAAVAGHSGELDPYGLPALLHRLAQGKANGTLNLLPREGGGAPATIGLSHGRAGERALGAPGGGGGRLPALRAAVRRQLRLRRRGDSARRRRRSPDLPSLVKEGVRRARELQRTSAVVPEELPLEATGAAPGTVVDEPDYDLIVALWEKACARVSVRQMEAELAADAFRVHRPLAQWLEEGALRIAAPPAEPAAPSRGYRDRPRHMSVMSSRGRAAPQCSSTSAMTPSMSRRPGLLAVGLEPGLEPGLAVLPVLRVLGLGHAVGVEHQPVAGVELHRHRREVRLRRDPERHRGGAEPRRRAARPGGGRAGCGRRSRRRAGRSPCRAPRRRA